MLTEDEHTSTGGYGSIDDNKTGVYIRNNPQLTSMDLSGCTEITNRTLWTLSALCSETLEEINVQDSKHVSLSAVADLLAKCSKLALDACQVPQAIKDKIDEATKGRDMNTDGRLALLIMAKPDLPQIELPCDENTPDDDLTSIVILALKGLANLRTEDGLAFRAGGWKAGASIDLSGFAAGSGMKMTTKQFSTLFPLLKGRACSLNLQNTGLSNTVGSEQLGVCLHRGGSLRYICAF